MMPLRIGFLIVMLAAPPAPDDLTVVEPSRLGIVVDGVDLGAGAEVAAAERYQSDETFPWRGVHSEGDNHYRGARIELSHGTSATPFVVDVRVFDDGVAFRYVVPGDGDRVPDEATTFRIPPGSRVWYHDFQGHYEGGEAAAVDVAESVVTRDDALAIDLRPGGGYIARISRTSDD